jgi:hypothetical protein
MARWVMSGRSAASAAMCDAHRLAQQLAGQGLHRRRKGGREEQVLPARRQQRQDARQLLGKAQVQQAVGLVEHQRGHCIQADRVVIDKVQQAPRRGHHDLRAAAQVQHLRVDRHPAEHDRRLQPPRQRGQQRAHGLAHLRGQLARGHQHQHAGAPGRLGRLVAELLQQRQQKGGRLAGAGLRGAQHIASAQDLRNGGRLDGGGLVQAQRGSGARQGRGESEFNKRHGPV